MMPWARRKIVLVRLKKRIQKKIKLAILMRVRGRILDLMQPLILILKESKVRMMRNVFMTKNMLLTQSKEKGLHLMRQSRILKSSKMKDKLSSHLANIEIIYCKRNKSRRRDWLLETSHLYQLSQETRHSWWRFQRVLTLNDNLIDRDILFLTIKYINSFQYSLLRN